MADNKSAYAASSDLAVTSLASLATSATFVAGAELGHIDNSSNKYKDGRLSGKIPVGTSPTAGTYIEIWVFAEQKDGVWPDVMDGTDSAETWTSVEMKEVAAKLAARIFVNATTSDREYPFDAGYIAALFAGGILPQKVGVFVTHNTAVNLKSSGAVVSFSPVYETVA